MRIFGELYADLPGYLFRCTHCPGTEVQVLRSAPPNPPKISLSPFREKKKNPAVLKCCIYVTSILSKNLYTAREDAAKSGVEAETALADALFRISWRIASRRPGLFLESREREKKSIIYTVYIVYNNKQKEATKNMACYCNAAECPFRAEGVPMNCKICPYSDGEDD